VSTKLDQIAKKAKMDRKVRFTSLAHLHTPEFLKETWKTINRKGASGIDGESIKQFESELEQRVQEICERLKAGAYQAPPVRRVEIPKGPGKTGTRPLGIPTVADRLLQKAVARILEAIFEADFCDVSYGYRPGRSPHHALRALREQIVIKKVSHIYEADIRGYFNHVSHAWLQKDGKGAYCGSGDSELGGKMAQSRGNARRSRGPIRGRNSTGRSDFVHAR
jgi:RNA-directed DNA polymerase